MSSIGCNFPHGNTVHTEKTRAEAVAVVRGWRMQFPASNEAAALENLGVTLWLFVT